MNRICVSFLMFVVLVTFPVSVSMSALTDGLVAYWAMDGDLADGSGNGNDGTPVGDPIWADGPIGFGQSLSFDGVDDHVTLGAGPSLSGPTDFTVGLWVKTDSSGENTLVQQRMGGGTGYLGQYILSVGTAHNAPIDPGQVYFMIYNNGFQWEIMSTQTINDGAWHYVAGVRSGEIGTIYIDGRADATATGPIQDLGGDIEVAIGRDIRDGGQYLEGQLDEVVIYNRALTENELAQLASSGPVATVEPTNKLATAWGALKQ
ncbi:LamG domain-containing protein [Candidatus Poribacteria bacterium]